MQASAQELSERCDLYVFGNGGMVRRTVCYVDTSQITPLIGEENEIQNLFVIRVEHELREQASTITQRR